MNSIKTTSMTSKRIIRISEFQSDALFVEENKKIEKSIDYDHFLTEKN